MESENAAAVEAAKEII
jgi:hypothetical protein